MPISSYTYNIDDKYIHKINELFWGKEIVYQMPTYEIVFDSVSFDIDGDGIKEDCSLGYGPTSGIDTFTFSVYENGELEYFNIFASLGVSNIHFYTKEDGQDISYCGEQGIDSPFAPK